jgi:DNA-binding transcriptional ArsR family regulator
MTQAHRKTALPASIAGRLKELQSNAKRAAPLLKAMSNPTRLVILCKIAEGERSVGELEKQVGLTQSGISQHLAVLRRERIVVTRRDKQTIFYSLASPDVIALMATLHKIFCKPPAPKAASRAKARALA